MTNPVMEMLKNWTGLERTVAWQILQSQTNETFRDWYDVDGATITRIYSATQKIIAIAQSNIEVKPTPPIPMIMYCPACHARHVDKGEYAIIAHHSHACQQCGTIWRPAIEATVGVQFLPGFKDRVEPEPDNGRITQQSWKVWIKLGALQHTDYLDDVRVFDTFSRPGYLLARVTLENPLETKP